MGKSKSNSGKAMEALHLWYFKVLRDSDLMIYETDSKAGFDYTSSKINVPL